MSAPDEIGMNPPATTTHDEHRSEQEHQDDEAEQDSELQQEHEHEEEDEDDDDDDEEEEFSFVCVDPETSSPISADDIFHDGQIRPLYPLFNQSLIFDDESDDHSTSPRPQLRNIFIEHPPTPILSKETTPTGTFCEWSSASSKSPDKCKKSNSTGFSKLRRFRNLLHRSTSDGKDTFVFLHIPSPSQQVGMAMESGEASSSSTTTTTTTKGDTNASVVKAKVKVVKSEKHVSAHERHYMRNRVLKEEEKRRSYLPYKVGFFTSASGLSRNVHPF